MGTIAKMNPDVKAKWLKALRSGDYRRVEGMLNRGGAAFCCLGVLTEIAVADGIIGPADDGWDENPFCSYPEGALVYRDRFDNGDSRMEGLTTPLIVRDWAGLEDSVPTVDITHWSDEDIAKVKEYPIDAVAHVRAGWPDEPFTATLTELNDNGFSFDVIADLIEEQL